MTYSSARKLADFIVDVAVIDSSKVKAPVAEKKPLLDSRGENGGDGDDDEEDSEAFPDAQGSLKV